MKTRFFGFITLFSSIFLVAACSAGIGSSSDSHSGGDGTIPGNFTVGGNITGLTGEIVLTNNDSEEITVDADGAFTFATPVTAGEEYSVSIASQPDGQLCAVENGSGTTQAEDILNIVVVCHTMPVIERVSVASDGTQAAADQAYTYSLAISGDGRYVAFEHAASNLVAGDNNGNVDIFVHDRLTGETTLASLASDGTQAMGQSENASISADGRYVAFTSYASNLVAEDRNQQKDAFVHDRVTGITSCVSVNTGFTELYGNVGDDGTYQIKISADGRFAAFMSIASDLVEGDTNDTFDIFVRDLAAGTTTRVSVASDGTEANAQSQGPDISADGRYVAFWSDATNLAEGVSQEGSAFVHDRVTGVTTLVSAFSSSPSISADGRYVAFKSGAPLVTGDTNGKSDIFVRDLLLGVTTRVSVASDGTQADDGSTYPSISADGRFVAFEGWANNLVSGDTNSFARDVFVHDRLTAQTTRVSVAADGTQANFIFTYYPANAAISADGRYVAFSSSATTLVPNDTNGIDDIFVRKL